MKINFALKAEYIEIIVVVLFFVFLLSLFVPKWIERGQNNILEKQTKLFYIELTSAMKKYMEENSYTDLRTTSFTWDRHGEETSKTRQRAVDSFNSFLKQKMKVRKTCPYAKKNECFAQKYGTVKKRKSGPGITEQESFLLQNGGSIQMLYPPTAKSPGLIVFDVNGVKGPNVGGRDIWSISLFWDGTMDESYYVPDNRNKADFENSVANDERFRWHCTSAAYDGGGCFGHFKEKDYKFDY